MAKKKSDDQEITVTGIINSIEWDDDDNITAVELSTDDEDFIVKSDLIGKELFDYVGEEVEVVGTVVKGKGDGDYIKILSYDVLDDFDDDYEDDDDFDYDDDDEDDDDDDDDFDDKEDY